MPPSPSAPLLGIDGCRAGWLVALQCPGTPLTFQLLPDLRPLLTLGPRAVAIDMPIGLHSGPRASSRLADQSLRRLLGPRRASVFIPPTRSMLSARRYEPSRLPGLSIQAFHLIPKIAELDALLSAAPQLPIHEAHPELAFAQLAGAPLTHPKRTAEGRAERLRLLSRQERTKLPGLRIALASARRSFRRADVALDDLHDAAVLLLVAQAIAAGTASRWPATPERDARGLPMVIHGLPRAALAAPDPRHERLLASIDDIPRGRVATYGQLAELAGLPGRARLVARLLSQLPVATKLPWWRVVAAPGRVAPRAPEAMAEQARRLRREGIAVSPTGRVSLGQHRWLP
jgi:predicted RNase H-like nuclease/alkylated DNA nucleotide flippase Atl1